MRVPDRIVGCVFEPLWDLYEGSRRLKTMRELASRQFDDVAVLDKRRSRRLNGIVVEAAAHVPFWRERFASAGIDPEQVHHITDLAALPLMTKTDVRGRLDDMINDRFDRADLTPAKTGGSTGTALHVFCDRDGIELRNGAALLADTWSGWSLGQPTAAVWGNPPVPRSLRSKLRRQLKDRVIYLDTMKLDEAAVATFVADWRCMRPGLLFGHAHSLFLFAEMAREWAAELNPRGIVATSMMLLDHERRVIEDVFGVPVTNRYGCEEVSLIACECERHQGMHLNDEHCWVELLRDDGTPCAPGEDGRIVVTEFVNKGMPMLRYEVGDRGVLHDRPCPCGRPGRLLRSLTGRTADFLVARDGSRVAGISLIENTLTRLPGIGQLQVVQDDLDHILLNVAPADGWNEDVAAELIAVFSESLGGGHEVRIEIMERIPREANGKYRFSICRIPVTGGSRGR